MESARLVTRRKFLALLASLPAAYALAGGGPVSSAAARPAQGRGRGAKSATLRLRPADLVSSGGEGPLLEGENLAAVEGSRGSAVSAVLTASLPFQAVAAQWSGSPEASVALRSSADGSEWTEWFTLGVEAVTDADAGTTSSSLFFTPANELHNYVQCQVSLDASKAKGRLRVAHFRLLFIDASEALAGLPQSLAAGGDVSAVLTTDKPYITSEALAGLPQSLAAGGDVSAALTTDKPYIVSRVDWGCPDGESAPGWDPPGFQYATVTHIILHHTATTNGPTDWRYQVYIIWYYHTYEVNGDGTGWGDIGYNFLVDPNGVIYEGRAGGDDVIAAHTGMFNRGSMGVAFIGTYETVEPTAAAVNATEQLLAWKCKQRGIVPAGTSNITATRSLGWGCSDIVVSELNIASHKDYAGHACPGGWDPNATSCPGARLHDYTLPRIRSDVNAVVQSPDYAAQFSNASISPPMVAVGSLLQVTVTVKNVGTQIMANGSPDPGYVYNEGEIAGYGPYNTFRLALDYEGHGGDPYPYRWGLGGNLGPGESRTITCRVKINAESGPKRYWLGLIREQVGMIVDHAQTTYVQGRVRHVSADVGIANVSIIPATVLTGSVLEVYAEVENWSSQTVPTQDPAPGYTYQEGQVCPADVPGAYRLGVDYATRPSGVKDHPYRWGVGDVPPYSVRTIRGYIRLWSTSGACNYWAGFVKEQVAWLQNNVATAPVTVKSPSARIRLPFIWR